MKQIAQGQVFKNIILKKRIYIDKTEQIYNLLQHDRVFISRPRRFGKSLMLDTIGSLFEDGVDPLFKDLWINNQWTEEKYPVLRLNFLMFNSENYDVFTKRFNKRIENFAKVLKLSDFVCGSTVGESLISLFDSIKQEELLRKQRNEEKLKRIKKEATQEIDERLEKESIEIIILIDEYDAQLTANINNPELYKKFQSTIKDFYGILKGQECIRFLGITGVTRLKDVEIFSVGSDIDDLSYHTAFSTIIGFTREEIKKYYIDYINLSVSIIHNIPEEQITEEQRNLFLDQLAEEYDGYCFDKRYKQKVFSTWSVNKFLSDVVATKEVIYEDYWFDNGGLPSILANYIKTHTINLEHYAKDIKVKKTEFEDPTSLLDMRQEVLMCQTGYLTIHSAFSDNNVVTLGFPNKEVQRALEILVSFKLFPNEDFDKQEMTQFFSVSLPEEIVNKFNLLMNSISYDEYQNINERTIQGFLHAFLIGAGQDVLTEKHSALGRSDIIIEYDNRRLVLELKYAETESECENKLQEAIKQIQAKNYGDVLPCKEVLKIALVFNGDPSKRKFTHFEVVE